MTVGAAKLACVELLLERKCTKADKATEILSSDSYIVI